ncbi:FadR/GntR family transcriptional regulator [Deinococcus altitudinis]|uniref:FadR/GntR family transcriptional regulator n=1 Tax=Deinococcus altitudinis TaxID=468914 RepID=UPI003892C1FC
MPFEALNTRRLYSQIADQVATLISTGEYQPGDQLLSERELADRLKVSRPTVREAMIALEVRGLIEIRVGVGIFVRTQPARQQADLVRAPDPAHSALEIIEARLMLEPQVAALAAERLSEKELKVLKKHLRQLKLAAAQGRWSDRDDRALHETIARASGNQVLSDMVQGLFTDRDDALALKFEEHLSQMPLVRDRSFNDHRRIIEALSRRDAQAARQAMHDHLASVQREMLAGWASEAAETSGTPDTPL